MRLLVNVGNDAPRVLVYIQKAKMRTGTDAHTVQFMIDGDAEYQRRVGDGQTCCYGEGPGSVAEAIEVLERALTHVISPTF